MIFTSDAHAGVDDESQRGERGQEDHEPDDQVHRGAAEDDLKETGAALRRFLGDFFLSVGGHGEQKSHGRKGHRGDGRADAIDFHTESSFYVE